MIRKSFVFLPKIGPKKEQNLWEQGITDWDDFISAEKIHGISDASKSRYDKMLLRAKKALRDNDSSFFSKLPSTETWRLYDYFRDESIFLDIEASGTSYKAYLTVIGLFDGYDTKVMIRDVNLDITALKSELQKYKLIITFNGSSFDLPFLQKKYPGLLPDVPHIDLRHLSSRIGLTGGLKHIEKILGIARENEIVDNFYGGDPLTLWRMYRGTGDRHYLQLLVEYNEEDVINLKKIAEHCVSEQKILYTL